MVCSSYLISSLICDTSTYGNMLSRAEKKAAGFALKEIDVAILPLQMRFSETMSMLSVLLYLGVPR